MTTDLTVAIPILARPDRIRRALKRFREPRVELLFLPDPDDEASLRELERSGAPYSLAPPAPAFGVPTYASKINHAYRVTNTAFLLYGSDDIVPQAGWWRAAQRVLADETIGLLATNDQHHYLVRRGKLATHGIVRRAYVQRYGTACLPDAGPIMFEGYRHACCDCEISMVARARDAFRYAKGVVLRHDHPVSRRARPDSTYALGQSFLERDRALRNERLPAWPG